MHSAKNRKGVDILGIFKIILVIVLIGGAILLFGHYVLDWDVMGFFQGFGGGGGGGSVGGAPRAGGGGGDSGMGGLGAILPIALIGGIIYFIFTRKKHKKEKSEKEKEEKTPDTTAATPPEGAAATTEAPAEEMLDLGDNVKNYKDLCKWVVRGEGKDGKA